MHIKNFDPYDFSKKEISGVPVYYKNLPWAPCIHIRIVFNTGGFDDPKGKEGLSHFFEHLIFDGSSMFPNKKAIKEWSKIYALNTWNAWTSYENTVYWLKCLPEHYDAVLVAMKDMIFSSLLKAESIEGEKKVITQEAWGRFKNEKFLKYTKKVSDNLYHGHDRARFGSPLGWPETIDGITQDDIVGWYKNHYGIGNFFIVLVGNVEDKHINKLKGFLKDLPEVNKVTKIPGKMGKPKENRYVVSADEIGQVNEQVSVSLVRSSDRVEYEKAQLLEFFPRLVQDLLYERLRIEHNLCYGVSVTAWSERTYSQVSMSVKTDEKNVELVEKEFQNIIEEIKKGKHIERFNLVKKLYIEQLKAAESLSGDIADDTLYEIVRFNGKTFTQKQQIKEIEKISYKQVVDLATQVFDPEQTFTEIILPSKK